MCQPWGVIKRRFGPTASNRRRRTSAFEHFIVLRASSFDDGSHPAAPLIIQRHVYQQHRYWSLRPIHRLPRQREYHLWRPGRHHYAHAPPPVRLAASHCHPAHGTAQRGGGAGHPPNLIAAVKRPVDFDQAPATDIKVPQCPTVSVVVEPQARFGHLPHGAKRYSLSRRASKKPIDPDCILARCHHAAQLQATTVAMLGTGTFCGTGRLIPARRPMPMHSKHQHTVRVIVEKAPTLTLINDVRRLQHPGDLDLGAGLQRLLNHRVCCTGWADKGYMQVRGGSRTSGELAEAMTTLPLSGQIQILMNCLMVKIVGGKAHGYGGY
jgi:hypothetical protein